MITLILVVALVAALYWGIAQKIAAGQLAQAAIKAKAELKIDRLARHSGRPCTEAERRQCWTRAQIDLMKGI